jgi:hypothetical protein
MLRGRGHIGPQDADGPPYVRMGLISGQKRMLWRSKGLYGP